MQRSTQMPEPIRFLEMKQRQEAEEKRLKTRLADLEVIVKRQTANVPGVSGSRRAAAGTLLPTPELEEFNAILDKLNRQLILDALFLNVRDDIDPKIDVVQG